MADWKTIGLYNCSYRGKSQVFSDVFQDFGGLRLLVATERYTPFVIRNATGHYIGYCIEFLKMIATHLNFTYELIESPDNKFGAKRIDGSWNGLVGMMTRQEADLVATGLTITSHREEVVDFTVAIWEELSAVLVNAEVIEELIKWDFVLSPLSTEVWLTILATLVFCSMLFCAMDLVVKRAKRDSQNSSTIHGSIWCMTSTGLRQGAEVIPASQSSRLLLAFLWIGMVILTVLYSANLTATLSTAATAPPLRTLRELADDQTYTITLNGGSAQRLLFEQTKKGVFADLWTKIESTKDVSLVRGTTTAMKMLFNTSDHTKYAVIGDMTSIQTKLARDYSDRCDWAFLFETFFKSGFGFALPEGSPYKGVFDEAILEVWKSGFPEKWQKQFFYNGLCGITSSYVNAEATATNLDSISAALVILSIGICLAFICFISEITIGQCSERNYSNEVAIKSLKAKGVYTWEIK